ncbi:2-polyprenyl-3-methyl-5-hydroxy-6-metoxy-1,4-benzoquinol methylase [Rhodoblastus acidophilus]|uniref:class I SAM-dependent methyltransferase n=1 Tax=Rhodoblastus acidophilus TaxID=1074 RepID=UPI0022258710|nr:class I SAM-dependent methyltransferase [Rhodoblastus acidophilus]MCW2283327.1 2-polyprenyl-3-methyl-5-hydroxy-6-metoxy-1,4-benzoquinol methylase [Rhodoblastus acidophilus]MCW2332349.1 2-polyprenyl-3-methyl-5-hydroxy-6-metoxy-1,4-benzoquinol methylase [Rhodoblastus acidophilus]
MNCSFEVSGRAARTTQMDPHAPPSPRILVAIASHGVANDVHLRRVIAAYRAMPFVVDIVVFSNIAKKLGDDVSVRVEPPPVKDPWSLPFLHKRLFVSCADTHDLFIYAEDDILITERNLRAFLEVSALLREDEIVGFVRYEEDSERHRSYPDFHWRYRWDPASVRTRDSLTLAHFTNAHSACYVLTRAQLKRAIASGGFDVTPHQEVYDLLCAASTDPYTQCGFTKLIPISRFNDFVVHHLSNKYAGKVGLSQAELDRQMETLRRIGGPKARKLFTTDSKLWQARHSKDLYAPTIDEVVAAVPRRARVLSIGAARGATERRLIDRECSVAALPLDPVFGEALAHNGVTIVEGDLAAAKTALEGATFDVLLFLDVLEFVQEPADLIRRFLSLLAPDGAVIISAPNLPRLRYLRRTLRLWRGFDETGVHPTSAWTLRRWCGRAGLQVTKVARRPASQPWFVPAQDLVVIARKS